VELRQNIESAVQLLMGGKAPDAWHDLSAHLPNPITRDFRAVFRREVVRRYNGGHEFIWNNGQWMVSPTVRQWEKPAERRRGPYRNILYCNQVLGTNVTYWTYSMPQPPGAPPVLRPNFFAPAPNGGTPAQIAAAEADAGLRYQFPWPVAFINAAGANYGPLL
jgi:hypothetical protein